MMNGDSESLLMLRATCAWLRGVEASDDSLLLRKLVDFLQQRAVSPQDLEEQSSCSEDSSDDLSSTEETGPLGKCLKKHAGRNLHDRETLHEVLAAVIFDHVVLRSDLEEVDQAEINNIVMAYESATKKKNGKVYDRLDSVIRFAMPKALYLLSKFRSLTPYAQAHSVAFMQRTIFRAP